MFQISCVFLFALLCEHSAGHNILVQLIASSHFKPVALYEVQTMVAHTILEKWFRIGPITEFTPVIMHSLLFVHLPNLNITC